MSNIDLEKISLSGLNLTSLRMAFPSLVNTIPPMGSKSILSMDLGPRVVLTTSETAYGNGIRESLGEMDGLESGYLLLRP